MEKKPLGPLIRVDLDLEDGVRQFAYRNRLTVTRAANVLLRQALERERQARGVAEQHH